MDLLARVLTNMLPVKVIPGSSRTCIVGWLGDALKIRVTAPPENGAANAAVTKLLDEVLAVTKGSSRVVSGGSSSRKLVEVEGLEDEEVRRRLARVLTSAP